MEKNKATSRNKILKAADNIYLSVGTYNSKYTWHYVDIDKLKLPIFLNDIKNKNKIDVAQYGKILFSGWGKEPPEDIKKKIEEMTNK